MDDCGVSRNTFYYYYDDLPQLVESIVNEDAEQMVRNYPTMETLEDCLDAVINLALQNRKAVMYIYHSCNRDLYEQYQWRICEHAVSTYVQSILSNRNVSEQDRRLIVDYLKCVFFGLIMRWLEQGMQEDIRTHFHRICELKHGSLEQMIDQCERQ